MPRTAHQPYAVLLAAVAALALGACTGGGAGPTVTTTTPAGGSSSSTTTASGSPSTTVSGSPTSTKSSGGDAGVPAAARVNSAAGAEAFTAYFFQQVNKSYATAQVSLMDPLVTAACKTCAGFRETVIQLKRQGHHYVGDFATPGVIEIATFALPEAKTFVATATPEHKIVDRDGGLVKVIAKRNFNVSVFLAFSNGWRVTEIKTAA